ncbi:Arsenate-mycothiol transferase ArsC1 [compost metagenome]
MERRAVYFLCTGNSCRSQMADGLLTVLGGERFEVWSAGLEAHGLNPRAVQVMQEIGIDISGNRSEVIDPDKLQRADYIITLCGHADEHCPVVNNPSSTRWHWGFDDPAQAKGTEEEILEQFRKVRDEIKARIERFVVTGE